MNIQDAPHGINLVIEKPDVVYIGRFDSFDGFQVLMHDCDVHPLAAGEDAAAHIRQTAKYGIAVNEKDILFEAAGIERIRLLGDIPQD